MPCLIVRHDCHAMRRMTTDGEPDQRVGDLGAERDEGRAGYDSK